MGTHDSQQFKSEADILARSSRPQHNSTWIPKTRDWRYATGVIQHDDHEDAPKTWSTWDVLDYDYQASGNWEPRDDDLSRSRSGTGSELGIAETTELAHTPEAAVLKTPTESPKVVTQPKGPYKPMEFRAQGWRQVTRLTRRANKSEEDGEEAWEITGLVVKFRFTRKNRVQIREILEGPLSPASTPYPIDTAQSPAANQNLTPPASSPNTPATACTAKSIHEPHILDSIESLRTFPLFQRTWVDETYDFNVKTVRSKLRPADKVVDDLGANYEWYDDAVPSDAIFPPGVPLSAKEIQAFYPHHVRWKGVMVRLTNNDYRGPEIMGMQAYFRGAPNHHTPPVYMNNYQRDLVKTALPGFKTASYKGKSDRNLRVDRLAPGPHIESTRKGYTLPTFEELVRGLHRLPSGLDARGLTQCISWYLNIRDTFTPKLELNVLHTQSLIRALREPLKPFGPQNLDRNALQEWKTTGTFETVEIEDKKHDHTRVTAVPERQCRTQMHMNLDKDDVSMNVTLPIRHVLTFPFLALHGVISEALKMGIRKAEMRRAARTEGEVENASEQASQDKDVDVIAEEKEVSSLVQPESEEPKKPYRIPKRTRPDEQQQLPAPKRPYASTGYRELAPAPPRSDSGHLSRAWNAPAPSSAYAPPPTGQESVYSRRDFAARQSEPRRGGGRPYNRSSGSGEGRAHYQGGQLDPRYGEGYRGDSYRP